MGNNQPLTLKEVRNHPWVEIFVRLANEHLRTAGFTEHGQRHANLVSHIAHNVLARLKGDDRASELAAIAGYLHDIGNVISRDHHGQTGAVLAAQILADLKFPPEEVAAIVGAIGNHEEEYGEPVNDVAAALILADKSDVHRSRVQAINPQSSAQLDIHDRVNYAVEHSFLQVDEKARTATLELTIDISICPVMEYFQIFLTRMVMCRAAAERLGVQFGLIINGNRLL